MQFWRTADEALEVKATGGGGENVQAELTAQVCWNPITVARFHAMGFQGNELYRPAQGIHGGRQIAGEHAMLFGYPAAEMQPDPSILRRDGWSHGCTLFFGEWPGLAGTARRLNIHPDVSFMQVGMGLIAGRAFGDRQGPGDGEPWVRGIEGAFRVRLEGGGVQVEQLAVVGEGLETVGVAFGDDQGAVVPHPHTNPPEGRQLLS
jgi:hypothetical protein